MQETINNSVDGRNPVPVDMKMEKFDLFHRVLYVSTIHIHIKHDWGEPYWL